MQVLEKILQEIDRLEDPYYVGYVERGKVKDIIRSHMNETTNDERLVKKFVTDRTVVRDFYDKPLYIKGCCPKCGCELKSCETDYCKVCGQALRWENPEGGL